KVDDSERLALVQDERPDTKLSDLSRLLPVLVKMTSGDSIPLNAQIDKIALGSIPDIGFKGDPGFHGPKRYDWAKLVGSVKYTLWRLQERVVGQGPDSSLGSAGALPEPGSPQGPITHARYHRRARAYLA
ncbi:hypothetical protein RBA07_21310, partial [Mycobacteroides abscessus subsp. abscessus]